MILYGRNIHCRKYANQKDRKHVYDRYRSRGTIERFVKRNLPDKIRKKNLSLFNVNLPEVAPRDRLANHLPGTPTIRN